MATKRQRSSPTGATPRKDEKRPRGKQLSFQSSVASWSVGEERTLTEYVLKKGYLMSWPLTKRTDFWESAAQYLGEQCEGAKRTSKTSISWHVHVLSVVGILQE